MAFVFGLFCCFWKGCIRIKATNIDVAMHKNRIIVTFMMIVVAAAVGAVVASNELLLLLLSSFFSSRTFRGRHVQSPANQRSCWSPFNCKKKIKHLTSSSYHPSKLYRYVMEKKN